MIDVNKIMMYFLDYFRSINRIASIGFFTYTFIHNLQNNSSFEFRCYSNESQLIYKTIFSFLITYNNAIITTEQKN